MRNPARPVGQQAVSTTELLGTARDAAVLAAQAALLAFEHGRWAPGQMGQQAYQLSVQIMALEAELGPVADAVYAERHIRVMSEAAHLVVQHARQAFGDGTLAVDPAALPPLFDARMDEMLMPAYAIVILA